MNTKDQEQMQSRPDYNRRYYQKNRQKILKRKKMRSKTNLFQLFPSASVHGMTNQLGRVLRHLEILAFAVLAFTITLFLIRESAGFYLDAQESHLTAYLKAIIIEVAAILFSFARGQSRTLVWSQKLLAFLLCGLTLWTVSGRLVSNAARDTGRETYVAKVIADLEMEQADKEALRKKFMESGWLTLTRRYEKGLDQVRERLASARETMNTVQSPRVIMNSLGILIAFRLIIVITNLICFHRIAEAVGGRLESRWHFPSKNPEPLLN